jgi:hypothetical protein
VFDISNVFVKVFVREFYRLNVGFFIVIITLTFGFMSGVEHKALAEFFIASPQLTLIPVAVWGVYAIKIIAFNRQRMILPENTFVYTLSILSKPKQLSIGLQTLFFQFTPAVLYGSFLILMALKHGAIEPIAIIIGSIATLLFVSAVFLLLTLKPPISEPRTTRIKKFIDKHTVRPLWWMYTTSVLRREPILFIGTKVFSGLLLYAVMKLYQNENYDGRLLGMAASVAGISNFMVMTQLQLFDLTFFSLMRNLPITLFARWTRLSMVTAITVLPEIVVILKYAPAIDIADLVATLVLIPAIALVTYSLLYFRFKDENTYSRLTFAMTMAHLVLILFRVPILIIVFCNLVASWFLFKARYYDFELSTMTKK